MRFPGQNGPARLRATERKNKCSVKKLSSFHQSFPILVTTVRPNEAEWEVRLLQMNGYENISFYGKFYPEAFQN
jgi:hypothetical protein